MDLINENLIRNRIKAVINEELHIAAESKRIVNNIISELSPSLSSCPITTDDNGFRYKEGKVQVESGNTKINIFYRCYIFKNNDEYEDFISLYDIDRQYSVRINKRLSFINVTFYTINGNLSKNVKSELRDTLYHEVSHVYQQLMANKNYRFNNDYSTAFDYLNSNDAIKRYVALVIYLSNKSEQIAYANGLYGFLENEYKNNDMFDAKAYKRSAIYKLLKQCYEAKMLFKDNREEVCRELNMYSLSYNRLNALCDQTIKSLEQKIGRVLIKFFNDKQKNGEITVTDTNNFYDLML